MPFNGIKGEYKLKKVVDQEQLVNQPYLSKIEIARLLNVPRRVATVIFTKAKEVDKKELSFCVYESKVRRSAVLKVCGLTDTDINR